MTKDDICKWMHMAWDFTSEDNLKRKFEYQEAHYIPYEKFARLVAEHEREACAKVCDGISEHYETRTDLNQAQKQVGQLAAEVCGVRIRERGEK